MRQPNTVTEDQLAAAFDMIAKVKLPAGFTVTRANAKPGRLGVVVRGPQTDGHPAGLIAWERDLMRQPMDANVVRGLIKSCRAWAQEEMLSDGTENGA